MLVWITQLGVSVAAPLAGFSLLGLWLRSRFSLGVWVMLACIFLGLICAVQGLRSSLQILERMDRQNEKRSRPTPPVSFNDHE